MIEVEGTTQPGPRPAEGDENGPADIIDGYRRACVELDDLLAQAGDVELQPDLETGGGNGRVEGQPDLGEADYSDDDSSRAQCAQWENLPAAE